MKHLSQSSDDFYSRLPTAVIPTVSGAMWQSVDPLGLHRTSDCSTMNQTPIPYPTLVKQRVPPLQTRPVTDCENLYPVVHVRTLSEKGGKSASAAEITPDNIDYPPSFASHSNPTANGTSATTAIMKAPKNTLPPSNGVPPTSKNILPPPSNGLLPSRQEVPLSSKDLPPPSNGMIPTVSQRVSEKGSIPSGIHSSSSRSSGRVARMAERVNKGRKCRLILWFTALICASNIVFFLFAYDDVVEKVAVSQLALRDSGAKFEAWSKSPIPVYYKVTAFNLTNPRSFMGGARPRVHEVGPYVYRMVEEKVDVVFHDNGTVSYRTKPTYFFEPDLSGGSENDTIWTVNIPFVNAADAVKHNSFAKLIVNYAKSIYGFETLRHLTVKELLWGHRSKVLDWGRLFQELPYPHPHFGLLVGMNDTAQQPYTMFTGAQDPYKMNSIYSWNGKTKLDFWAGESCNQISGTDAGGFKPGVSPADTLYIFNGQLCRAIPLVYEKRVHQGGIDALRFSPPGDVFSYGPDHPENTCYCTDGACPPQGVLDMRPCYWGAAIAFSFPHFLHADSTLRHMVRGLK